jgi:CDP-paratose synthetase
MNILMTGATGFIGSHLLSGLGNGAGQVFCLVQEKSKEKLQSPKNTEILTFKKYGEIPALLADKKFDVVFHLATYFSRQHSPSEIQKIVDSNVTLGSYILDAVSKYESVFVHTDTYFYFSDHGVTVPETLYAATKSAFNEILKFYSNSAGLRVLDLCLTDTYGPNDPRDKLINLIMKSMKGGGASVKISNPDKEINLLHVDDVVEALIGVIENAKSIFGGRTYKKYALRPDSSCTIRSLVERLRKENPELLVELGSPGTHAPGKKYLQEPILPNWRPTRTDPIKEILSIVESGQ